MTCGECAYYCGQIHTCSARYWAVMPDDDGCDWWEEVKEDDN